ncbi:MAG: RNA polymerase sigma factor [bacterium]
MLMSSLAGNMNGSRLRSQLETYHKESYGWALRCCSQDATEAEEVLQMVYVKILEGKANYEGKAKWKTWLFAVIRNTAAEQRRKNRLRRQRVAQVKERFSEAISEVKLEEEIHRNQVRRLFREALAGLSKKQQEVLQLVFYHDFSLREAAATMGISIGSARTHYERGKKRLRESVHATLIREGLH